MEEQSNGTLEEQVSSEQAVTQQTSDATVEQPADTQVAQEQTLSADKPEVVSEQEPANVSDEASAGQAETQDKKKKQKKKDKKPTAKPEKPEKKKREGKVGLYVVSLFKYFNIITLLPFALIMYAVFFSSYIVDKGEIFKQSLLWICIIMGVAAIVMVAWFITTIKKRRVCSFDAFLLMALLICASMIAQCVIFKNFNSFDGIAIATVAATAAVFIMLTVRLILFKPSEQRKNDDAKYTAGNKLTMYFKVIFAKYFFFITMLCIIGALLILIITQSNIFEDFAVIASQTEKIVTMVFAGLAALLMIVGIFIRIVRGRANVIDCMPYMLFMVTIGGLINFITRHTYQILYIAIGSFVVGVVWLLLCQYTLLMSNYKKVAQESASNGNVDNNSNPEAQPTEQAQVVEEPQTVSNVQPVMDAQPTADTQTATDAQQEQNSAASSEQPTA